MIIVYPPFYPKDSRSRPAWEVSYSRMGQLYDDAKVCLNRLQALVNWAPLPPARPLKKRLVPIVLDLLKARDHFRSTWRSVLRDVEWTVGDLAGSCVLGLKDYQELVCEQLIDPFISPLGNQFDSTAFMRKWPRLQAKLSRFPRIDWDRAEWLLFYESSCARALLAPNFRASLRAVRYGVLDDQGWDQVCSVPDPACAVDALHCLEEDQAFLIEMQGVYDLSLAEQGSPPTDAAPAGRWEEYGHFGLLMDATTKEVSSHEHGAIALDDFEWHIFGLLQGRTPTTMELGKEWPGSSEPSVKRIANVKAALNKKLESLGVVTRRRDQRYELREIKKRRPSR